VNPKRIQSFKSCQPLLFQDSLPTDWQKYETYSDKDCQTMISNAKERLNSLGLVNKAAGLVFNIYIPLPDDIC